MGLYVRVQPLNVCTTAGISCPFGVGSIVFGFERVSFPCSPLWKQMPEKKLSIKNDLFRSLNFYILNVYSRMDLEILHSQQKPSR